MTLYRSPPVPFLLLQSLLGGVAGFLLGVLIVALINPNHWIPQTFKVWVQNLIG